MLIDAQLAVSTNQVVTVTAVSTSAIDTGGSSPVRNVGWGEEMRMMVQTATTVAAAGAATVTFEVIQADDAALTTNVETLISSAAIGKAALTAGGPLPLDVVLPSNTRRYIGVRYTVGTGPLTAGAFTAALVHDTDRQKFYANGYPNLA